MSISGTSLKHIWLFREGSKDTCDLSGGKGANMMDTVLKLGLSEATLQGLMADTCDERFACDPYRRFLMMFSDITMSHDNPDLKKEAFDHAFKMECAINAHSTIPDSARSGWVLKVVEVVRCG